MDYKTNKRRNAPILVVKGRKMGDDMEQPYYAIPQDMADILFSLLGDRSAQLRIMMVLCGTRPGFVLSEKWMLERTGLTHASYIRARKELSDEGWINYDPHRSITVDYNYIYGEMSEVYEAKKSKKSRDDTFCR